MSAIMYLVNKFTFPLRLVLPQNVVSWLGLDPVLEDRIHEVYPLLRGRVLDVGCGDNNLMKRWGNGQGVDIDNWNDAVDVVCKDTSNLPFDAAEFDVVTFIACLNHIPNREEALDEAYRVMKPQGTIVLTMITPKLGVFVHMLVAHWDRDQNERKMDEKEEWGLSDDHLRQMLNNAGFCRVHMKRFGFLGFNHLFVAQKSETVQ